MTGDTIVALSSGALPAGIAVVRTSGPEAFAAAARIAGDLPEPRHASLRSFIDPADGSLLDRGLLLCLDGPRTATGEDIVEYHCHGGRATVAALLKLLESQPGMRAAEPGEFTRRALANGIIDLTEAEGLADLLSAETELQRKVALRRSEGAVRQEVEKIREALVALSAAAEIAIDYIDEEDGAARAAELDLHPITTQITELVERAPVERMRTGIRIVVAGPTNSGKSSLINSLAESERAIVTDIAGTTRDVIEVPLALSGIPVVLVDTAGLRESGDVVERIGIARAGKEIERADIVLWLGDEAQMPQGAILVAGKSDLHTHLLGLPFSAVTGEGREELIGAIVGKARDLLPTADDLALTNREQGLLKKALAELSEIGPDIPLEIAAEYLRRARAHIGLITGEADVEAVLDALFSRFCVGK